MLLREHRQWMKTDKARNLYARRQQLSEPTFGILKEQLGARRFLLRGLANVRAEFTLMATAFNLRTLSRVWNRVKNVSQLIRAKWQQKAVTAKVLETTLNSHYTFVMKYLRCH
jgi:hypothetical protein